MFDDRGVQVKLNNKLYHKIKSVKYVKDGKLCDVKKVLIYGYTFWTIWEKGQEPEPTGLVLPDHKTWTDALGDIPAAGRAFKGSEIIAQGVTSCTGFRFYAEQGSYSPANGCLGLWKITKREGSIDMTSMCANASGVRTANTTDLAATFPEAVLDRYDISFDAFTVDAAEDYMLIATIDPYNGGMGSRSIVCDAGVQSTTIPKQAWVTQTNDFPKPNTSNSTYVEAATVTLPKFHVIFAG